MQIREKLALSFALLALLVPAAVAICLHVTDKAMQRAIGADSAVLVRETLDKIERGIWRRLEQAQLYAHALRYDETLLDANYRFDKMRETERYIAEVDRRWVTAVADGNPLPIMTELCENDLSRRLRFEMMNESFYRDTYGYPVFAEALITNRYGAIAAQTGGASDYNQADELWWQRAHKDGFYVGDVQLDSSTGVWGMNLAVRVNDVAGSFLGVLKLELDAREVISVLDEVRREIKYHGSDLILLTDDLRVIHSTDGRQDPNLLVEGLKERFTAKSGETPWFILTGHGMSGRALSGRHPSLIAQTCSRGHRDFNGNGWMLVVSHDVREVFAPIVHLGNSLMLLSAGITILAMIVSMLIARSIATPIQTLAMASLRISRGNLDVPILIQSCDETGHLAKCLQEMTGRLKTTIQTLRAEVAERQRAEGNLEAVNRELARAVLKLTEANKELNDFTYAAAHDLKTPVRGIAMLAEWLLGDCGDKLGPSGREQLQLLLRRARRSNRLIDSIQDYAHAGHTEGAACQVDVQDLVADVVEAATVPPEVCLHVTIERETAILPAEAVRHVLSILIDNAVRYMDKPQGRIVVRCVCEGDSLRFSVTDNGPGIDARYHEKIFAMFQTLSLRDEVETAGMGLCIAKKIVEHYGGRIWVESEPGDGSTFHLIWPQDRQAKAPRRPALALQ